MYSAPPNLNNLVTPQFAYEIDHTFAPGGTINARVHLVGANYYMCSQNTGGAADIWLDHIESTGLTKSFKYTPATKSLCITVGSDGPNANRFLFLNENKRYVIVSINMATGVGHYAMTIGEISGTDPYDNTNNKLHGVLSDGAMGANLYTSTLTLSGIFVGGLATSIKQ